ncbi:hypothetical protein Acid7E03_39540 [Acidisoma sp. 7E03]
MRPSDAAQIATSSPSHTAATRDPAFALSIMVARAPKERSCRTAVSIAKRRFCSGAHALNRTGFPGGSNFQVEWSYDEQDDEQIQP